MLNNCMKQSIVDWLAVHKSSTLPAWLKRNPVIFDWVIKETLNYSVKNVMEQVYIIMHGPTPVCNYGNNLQFNTYNLGYRVGCVLGNKCKCVSDARMKNQKITIQERYGVDKVNSIPGIANKRKQTNIEKFGVEYPAQAESVKQKHTQTVLARTDKQRAEIAARTRVTNIEKFGVTHHMKLAEQVAKVQFTNLERYKVVAPLQNLEILARMKTTWANKSTDELSSIVDKTQTTMMQRYGVNFPSQIPVPAESLEILHDKDQFIKCITGKTRLEALDILQIAPHTLYLYATKYQVTDLFTRPLVSKFETEVIDFIKSLGITPQQGNRTVLSPKELDIFIPEKNIAIECCGIYWHSENSAGRDKHYHYDKFVKCREQGITLITLFDDEWNMQLEKVKFRLTHLLGITTNKIFARNCTITECNADAAKAFVNSYHLQGHITSRINLSLEYQGNIVAVMTLGAPRFNKKYQYEILRFCTNASIPGAASKLFKYFIRQYSPISVISYSDNRWGRGKVYASMNFVKHAETIGFYYTDYKNRFNRTKFQKYKLVATGADVMLTEWQIMQKQGYDRIWDCGQSVWTYTGSTADKYINITGAQ